LYKQLFGVPETKKPASAEIKKNENNASAAADEALFKYVQEETMKRRAAEANGEFDRQAAIAKIDYEA
jgi:hypothetical protein